MTHAERRKKVGLQIRAKRTELGLTQLQLANRSDLDLRSIYKIEMGDNFTINSLMSVLDVLGMKIKIK